MQASSFAVLSLQLTLRVADMEVENHLFVKDTCVQQAIFHLHDGWEGSVGHSRPMQEIDGT